ncbi:hypothetical protein M430DRAFT_197874 [Amorphotheca resinae ATCC 22711]|uniref:Uncharacterized protein n=1 Tax=Amorphotheca resinae ATCC 22711 TaxID=857342 RepID=A0A2T3B9Q4_AMORE|nr:hypothetical protein M430DRAFT_197874 [Amorphotheca resinae ATCC 22711]PSS25056.1 hypothetical protein M430DRAFT_197874 [Amorphotheca resinae ATCC 22711]
MSIIHPADARRTGANLCCAGLSASPRLLNRDRGRQHKATISLCLDSTPSSPPPNPSSTPPSVASIPLILHGCDTVQGLTCFDRVSFTSSNNPGLRALPPSLGLRRPVECSSCTIPFTFICLASRPCDTLVLYPFNNASFFDLTIHHLSFFPPPPPFPCSSKTTRILPLL